MKTKSTLTAGPVICALLGVIFGSFIKNLPEYFGLSDLIEVLFTIFGALAIFSGIPGLIFGINFHSSASGKISFVYSVISIAAGLVLIFYHSRVILLVVAAYLVVFPAVQIICTRGKSERRKAARALIPKIVLGLLLVLFFPAASGIADALFSIVLKVFGWGIIALSLILLAVALVLIHRGGTSKGRKKRRSDDGTIYLDEDDVVDKSNQNNN